MSDRADEKAQIAFDEIFGECWQEDDGHLIDECVKKTIADYLRAECAKQEKMRAAGNEAVSRLKLISQCLHGRSQHDGQWESCGMLSCYLDRDSIAAWREAEKE